MSEVLSFESTPEVAAVAREPSPTLLEAARAVASMVLLGGVAGLGTGALDTAARTVPSGVAAGVGALLLTAPALVVVHQYLGLQGSPEALVAALLRAVVRLGTLCLGAVPLVLFFSVTSRLSVGLYPVCLGVAGVFALTRAARELLAVESDTDVDGRLAREGTMALLVLGWCGLTVLVALRLAWDVAWFVVGGAA